MLLICTSVWILKGIYFTVNVVTPYKGRRTSGLASEKWHESNFSLRQLQLSNWGAESNYGCNLIKMCMLTYWMTKPWSRASGQLHWLAAHVALFSPSFPHLRKLTWLSSSTLNWNITTPLILIHFLFALHDSFPDWWWLHQPWTQLIKLPKGKLNCRIRVLKTVGMQIIE